MVVSWLTHSISPSIRQSILWMNKYEEIWKGNLLHISELQLEASSLKQGSLSVTEYFTKIHVIWDELYSFCPNLVCSCPVKCVCGLVSSFHQRKIEDHVM